MPRTDPESTRTRRWQRGIPYRSIPAALLVAGLTVAAGLPAGGCGLGEPAPATLEILVAPAEDGALVEVEVSGGPRPVAWVGFGVTAEGLERTTDRVSEVRARRSDGTPMPVERVGPGAFRVEVASDGPWLFQYRLELTPLPTELYHRASSRSSRHLLLVGADAWPRLYRRPGPLQADLSHRPSGDVAEATVRFDSMPQGWRVVSAAPAIPGAPGGPDGEEAAFRLLQHPARSVFAAGPYRTLPLGEPEAGMRAAVHADWQVARRSLRSMSARLLAALAAELGPPPDSGALLIFTPLPREFSPADGLRTAGMVWGRSLVLFAGAGEGIRTDTREAQEMVAVFIGHELFHLYVPWGIEVAPELAWLSEGWAMHMGRRAAVAARLMSPASAADGLREAHTRYLEVGGFQAGSLPDASSVGGEKRELLYLRGELVFHLLSRQWETAGRQGSFDVALWRRLLQTYDGRRPLQAGEVMTVLRSLVDPLTVRRYVEGTAPISRAELGLP